MIVAYKKLMLPANLYIRCHVIIDTKYYQWRHISHANLILLIWTTLEGPYLLYLIARTRHELAIHIFPLSIAISWSPDEMKCRICNPSTFGFMTLLIAENEAQSAELVQAIPFSYPFFLYPPEPLHLSNLFPTYRPKL